MPQTTLNYRELILTFCNGRLIEKSVRLTRHKSITLGQALAGLALQGRDDDGSGISVVVVVQHCALRFIVVSVGAVGSGPDSVGAVIAGVRIWGVVDSDTADDVLPQLG